MFSKLYFCSIFGVFLIAFNIKTTCNSVNETVSIIESGIEKLLTLPLKIASNATSIALDAVSSNGTKNHVAEDSVNIINTGVQKVLTDPIRLLVNATNEIAQKVSKQKRQVNVTKLYAATPGYNFTVMDKILTTETVFTNNTSKNSSRVKRNVVNTIGDSVSGIALAPVTVATNIVYKNVNTKKVYKPTKKTRKPYSSKTATVKKVSTTTTKVSSNVTSTANNSTTTTSRPTKISNKHKLLTKKKSTTASKSKSIDKKKQDANKTVESVGDGVKTILLTPVNVASNIANTASNTDKEKDKNSTSTNTIKTVGDGVGKILFAPLNVATGITNNAIKN